MRKLYVGCALSQAPGEFVGGVLSLKETLRKSFEIFDFRGLAPGAPHEIFTWDIGCVEACEVMLGICDYPSTGLGYEIAHALYNGKLLLAVASQTAHVSRLIVGIHHPNFSFQRYKDLGEVPDLLEKFLNESPATALP